MTSPALTIGVPALNRGDTLPRALDSLLAQTRRDFVILIADNASTDNTAEIAHDYAERDKRVTVVRRPTRVTAVETFRLLAEAATTPFFMFAPADDFWHPDFVAETLRVIEADPAASLACPRVEFARTDGSLMRPGGTYTIEGDIAKRMATYIGSPGCNSRFYGIHRTETLTTAFHGVAEIIGWDWLVMVKSLIVGTHREVDQILMTREAGTREAQHNMVARAEPNRRNRALPGLRLTQALMRNVPRETLWRIAPAIAKMNFLMLQGSPYRLSRAVYWGIRKPTEMLFGRPARIS